jgi:hypothetical protein
MDKNEHGTAYYLNNENDSFVVMRLVVDNKHTEYEKDFPNRKSLKKAYKKMIDVQIKAMSKKSFVFKDSAEITINDFIGYKITYQEEHSENQNAESILLLINGINYIATYSKVNVFNELNKSKFLNSIKIDLTEKPEQIAINKKFNLENSVLKLDGSGLLLFGILYLRKKLKNKNVG